HQALDQGDQWLIQRPNPRQRETQYDIAFVPGDTVTVVAGGCVQTGGGGATWKRYVDPRGPNSDRLYHGLIRLPGLGLERLQDFFHRTGGRYTIPANPGDRTLHLGYEDDGYGDNGYWGHDDGTGNQCIINNDNDGGAAWVVITVQRDGVGGVGGGGDGGGGF